ncbi:MAG: hypothetical protein JO348_00010 [Alphaproteobacteria bacterium]|nr:hypothetical protein [Alphaproteobacteria bacterium]MBV9418129.1 hypothetical protein [Alphaproteobacteria bacterium]
MAIAATLKAPVVQAPTEVTTRGKVIIGGRRLEELFADVLEGRIDYETNLFRILCHHELAPDLARLAGPMLIGLATGQSDMRDLESVRLAASTHAPFEMALLPFLRHADRFAQAMKRLRLGDARAAASVPAGALLAQRLKTMLAQARPASRYLAVLDACEHLSAELVAAAYLLECGVAPEVAPFVKIAARLPAAGAVYLAELQERPNRYTGIDLRTEGRGAADVLAETGLDLLDRKANFAAVMVRLALGRTISAEESVPVNAALVAGAEYGGNSASSLMMRMIADEHATAADAMQAMIATFGCYHLGALKSSAAIIASVADGVSIDDAIGRHAITDPQGRIRVAGFGHRFQKRDPRSVLLLAMCKQRYPGKFIDAASALDEALGERRLGYINMDGIGAAMGLQGGMAPDIVSLLTLIARAPGIAKALRAATPLPLNAELKARAGLV